MSNSLKAIPQHFEDVTAQQDSDILLGSTYALWDSYHPFEYVSDGDEYVPYKRPQGMLGSYAVLNSQYTGDGLDDYMSRLDDIPMLTDREEQARLSKYIQAGEAAKRRIASESESKDEDSNDELLTHQVRRQLGRIASDGTLAHEDFFLGNLKLVAAIAHKQKRVGIEIIDLIQDGNIRLYKKIPKFDWRKGFAFSTYVYRELEGTIARSSTYQNIVRLPINVHTDLSKLRRTMGRLEEQDRDRKIFGDEVDLSIARLHQETGFSTEEIEELLFIDELRHVRSFEQPLTGEGMMVLGDTVANINAAGDTEKASLLSDDIIRAIQSLITEREFEVLSRHGLNRQGQGETLREIAESMGVKFQRIHQIEHAALAKLRKPEAIAYLRNFNPF